jgi:hypothetical protein
MSRKLYFHNYRVLKAKRRVFGKVLPSELILVKLRRDGELPQWVILAREIYEREKRFRAVSKPLRFGTQYASE